MAEIFRDLELEKKINEWKKFFGYRTVDDFEVQLLENVRVEDTTMLASVYDGFPDPPFRIQVGNERVPVNKIKGHTLYVRRGLEGTVAQTHLIGDKVSLCQP